MRVLLAHTSSLPDRMGGSERVAWQLARGLVARGHAVRMIAPRLLPARPAAVTIDGVELRRYRDPLSSSALAYLPSLIAARAAVRAASEAWSPDVVHAHHGISGLGAAWAGRPLHCYTFYGPWHLEFLAEVADGRGYPWLKRYTRRLWAPAKARLAHALEGAAVRRSERLVVLSQMSARQIEEVHRGAGARSTVIPGGVDLDRFAPAGDRRAARRALGLPDGPLVFTVRRLVPRMGLEGLLHAFTRLPGVQLVIGGSGPLRPHLDVIASHLGLADRVRFTGFIQDGDLPRFYGAADLVVMPSLSLEGFGLIALEALACGTPVVAAPSAGAADVLRALEPSWLAPDHEPATFARTMSAALERAAADPELGERCRRHAEAFGWDSIAGCYERLYEALARS